MTQIVPGQEAVQLGEFIENKLAVVAAAFQHGTIDAPAGGVVFAQRFRQFNRHRLGIEDIAAQQHRTHAQHVIGSFTVDQRALPGGIRVNHPAKGRAVAGGKLRGKKVAVRLEILIKLIFDDARFDPHPPLFRVDLNDAVHIARHINNDALVQRLTVGPGAAAARRKDQRGKPLLRGQPGDKRDVGR